MINIVDRFRDRPMDGIQFFKLDDEYSVSTFTYNNKGEKIEGSVMGDFYHIIVIPNMAESIQDLEKTEAILSSPLHYVERLINDGFSGVVAKVTTTSEEVMKHLYDEMKEKGSIENDEQI